MCYEGNRRLIGMRPFDPAKRNAFRLKRHGRKGNYWRISASAFLVDIRLRPEKTTILFNSIDLDNEGMLMLDLTDTITVRRGAR